MLTWDHQTGHILTQKRRTLQNVMYRIQIGFHIWIRSISYAFFVYYICLLCCALCFICFVPIFFSIECSIVRQIFESSFQSNTDLRLKDEYQFVFLPKKINQNAFIVDVVSQAKQQMIRFFSVSRQNGRRKISVNLMVHHINEQVDLSLQITCIVWNIIFPFCLTIFLKVDREWMRPFLRISHRSS